MNATRRWALVAGGAGASLLAAYLLFRVAAANAPAAVASGAFAPDFSAATLDPAPQTRTLADFRGAPILLNVWATWCDPCRDEMPSMQRLYDAYKDRGLRIVAISIDDRGNEGLIRDFAAEHHLTFDILHDDRSAIMSTYQVRGVPETFLISRGGEIVGTRFVADWATAESHELVERLLLGAERAR